MFEEGQEILDKRYRVIKKLGGGAFGEIYKGMCTLTHVTQADFLWRLHLFASFKGRLSRLKPCFLSRMSLTLPSCVCH